MCREIHEGGRIQYTSWIYPSQIKRGYCYKEVWVPKPWSRHIRADGIRFGHCQSDSHHIITLT